MSEVVEQLVAEDDGEKTTEDILAQFGTDEGTIVLSGVTADMNTMQLQTDDGTTEFFEEMIGGTGDQDTQPIDQDQMTQEQMQDLITLHAVDSQGNIISTGEATEDTLGEQHVEIAMDQNSMEQMIEEDHMVEEVIDEGNGEENFLTGENIAVESEMPQQFLNVQEAIFNPTTGTLQPITSTISSSQQTTQVNVTKSPKKAINRAPNQQMVTKYIIAQQPGEMGGHQILLDASSLQNLLQGGGGGNISFVTQGGVKQNVVISSPSRPKPPPVSAMKSPAKILPAPVPIGDQQQHIIGSPVPQRFLLKQGNVLTPISTHGGHGGGKLIQIPTSSGNQIQYLRVIPNKQIAPSNKLPIAPSITKPKPVAPKPSPGQTIITLPPGTSASDIANIQNSGLGHNFVVVPNYVHQVKGEGGSNPIPIRPIESSGGGESSIISHAQANQAGFESFRSLLEPNGMRPRKPCNCTKSQCLKLYCDCFANGEFCHLCNCNNCFNNLNHEEDRQKAIKLVLERNPGAFRPKIGKSSQSGEAHERRHNKGCNCRRSGCLKNYCECYEAKIFCSGICKCTGCKNCIENIPTGLPNGVGVEQHFAGAGTSHRQTLKDLAEAAEVRVQQQNQVKNKMRAQMQDVSPQNNLGIMVPPLVFPYPHGSISYEVVTSTVELLLAKAESAEKQKLPDGEVERLLLDEFGDCLSAVMELGNTVE